MGQHTLQEFDAMYRTPGRRSGPLRAPKTMGPFEGILTEQLPEGCTNAEMDAHIEARFDALFDHYGIECPNTDDWTEESRLRLDASKWEFLATSLVFDILTCMWGARPVGRPWKLDFTDRDAEIMYVMLTVDCAMCQKCRSNPRNSLNAWSRRIAKMLGEENPIKIKNRYQTLRRRPWDIQLAMYDAGRELMRARKSGAIIRA